GAIAQARDHLEQLGPNPRVEADRRLVKEEHARMRDQGAGDLEPPALTAAVAAGRSLDQLGEAERAGELVDPPGRPAGLPSPEAGMDLEVPGAAERAVDHRLLEDDAADSPGGDRLPRHVEARQPGAPGGRLDRRRQHPDRGRLAGAVRAEQAEDL